MAACIWIHNDCSTIIINYRQDRRPKSRHKVIKLIYYIQSDIVATVTIRNTGNIWQNQRWRAGNRVNFSTGQFWPSACKKFIAARNTKISEIWIPNPLKTYSSCKQYSRIPRFQNLDSRMPTESVVLRHSTLAEKDVCISDKSVEEAGYHRQRWYHGEDLEAHRRALGTPSSNHWNNNLHISAPMKKDSLQDGASYHRASGRYCTDSWSSGIKCITCDV